MLINFFTIFNLKGKAPLRKLVWSLFSQLLGNFRHGLGGPTYVGGSQGGIHARSEVTETQVGRVQSQHLSLCVFYSPSLTFEFLHLIYSPCVKSNQGHQWQKLSPPQQGWLAFFCPLCFMALERKGITGYTAQKWKIHFSSWTHSHP